MTDTNPEDPDKVKSVPDQKWQGWFSYLVSNDTEGIIAIPYFVFMIVSSIGLFIVSKKARLRFREAYKTMRSARDRRP